MRAILVPALFASLLALAACGESVPVRTTTGALGGAVAGTVVGAPLVGAAAGGTYGAVTADD